MVEERLEADWGLETRFTSAAGMRESSHWLCDGVQSGGRGFPPSRPSCPASSQGHRADDSRARKDRGGRKKRRDGGVVLTASQRLGGLSPIGELSASERLPHPEADGVLWARKRQRQDRRCDGEAKARRRQGQRRGEKAVAGSSGQGTARKLPGRESRTKRVELEVGEKR